MFCHQRNGFLENHPGTSSSMFCPNLAEKPIFVPKGKYIVRISHSFVNILRLTIINEYQLSLTSKLICPPIENVRLR